METKLLETKTVAEGTMWFKFEKPEGFSYRAGQNIDLTLINPTETDAEGNTRTFTLITAPDDEYLAITTRMRDTAFKRTLKNMEPGTPLSFRGPHGSFTLHENTERPAVFLAGGIGITPFHSIIVDATRRSLPHRLLLFYSNRRPEDAAFLDGLAQIAKEHPNFTLIATMTEMAKSAQKWDGEEGYITSAMLKEHGALERNPVFYLAGPAAMVAALRATLSESGVMNDDIRTEEFAGY